MDYYRILLAIGFVRITRREMDQHFTAVQAFPPKIVVREFIDQAPTQFLGQESWYPNMLYRNNCGHNSENDI